MRILQAGNDVLPTMGGIPQAIADVQRAMGGEVVSLTNPALLQQASGPVLHVPQSSGILGRAYGWTGGAPPEAARRAFAESDLVLIHGMFRHHYGWAARLARQHGKPYLIFPHGALDPHVFSYGSVQKELWWKTVGAPVLRGASGVVYMSQRERAKASTRVRVGKAHVVYLPIEEPPAVSADEREMARAKLRAGPDDRIVLFLGRLHTYKRVPVIIDGFSRFDLPNLRLVVAGPDGPSFSRAECQALVPPHARDRVHVVGPIYGQEKHALIAASDGFVNVSARENFGYAICESLAAGVPGIVGPGNDMSSELEAAGGIWRLERDDAAAVAEGFRAFAEAPADRLKSMGEAGQRWVRQNLGLQRFRDSLDRVFTGVVT